MMEQLCEKAGVKKFGFHAIRHHVAMILEDSGKATLREIQKMLRHQRPTTTDKYLEGLSPAMEKVADILDEPKSTNLKADGPIQKVGTIFRPWVKKHTTAI